MVYIFDYALDIDTDLETESIIIAGQFGELPYSESG